MPSPQQECEGCDALVVERGAECGCAPWAFLAEDLCVRHEDVFTSRHSVGQRKAERSGRVRSSCELQRQLLFRLDCFRHFCQQAICGTKVLAAVTYYENSNQTVSLACDGVVDMYHELKQALTLSRTATVASCPCPVL
jgi:hypothetical protein